MFTSIWIVELLSFYPSCLFFSFWFSSRTIQKCFVIIYIHVELDFPILILHLIFYLRFALIFLFFFVNSIVNVDATNILCVVQYVWWTLISPRPLRLSMPCNIKLSLKLNLDLIQFILGNSLMHIYIPPYIHILDGSCFLQAFLVLCNSKEKKNTERNGTEMIFCFSGNVFLMAKCYRTTNNSNIISATF